MFGWCTVAWLARSERMNPVPHFFDLIRDNDSQLITKIWFNTKIYLQKHFCLENTNDFKVVNVEKSLYFSLQVTRRQRRRGKQPSRAMNNSDSSPSVRNQSPRTGSWSNRWKLICMSHRIAGHLRHVVHYIVFRARNISARRANGLLQFV